MIDSISDKSNPKSFAASSGLLFISFNIPKKFFHNFNLYTISSSVISCVNIIKGNHSSSIISSSIISSSILSSSIISSSIISSSIILCYYS